MLTNLNNEKMIYSIGELKKMNFTNYKINKMVDQGLLKKLNRSYYENANYTGDFNDFVFASAYIPKGVICLMSAASYYGLTTVRPIVVDMAIPNKGKVSTLPEWPEINLYYFGEVRYSEGVVKKFHEGDQFMIYEIEKTVVDIISYREKIGIEETKEILKNYLDKKERNINLLLRYAKVLKCESVLRKYLEVLL